jgi:hypothetical protein
VTASAVATVVEARAPAHAATGRRRRTATAVTATVMEARSAAATAGDRPNRTAASPASGYATRLAVTAFTEAPAMPPRPASASARQSHAAA